MRVSKPPMEVPYHSVIGQRSSGAKEKGFANLPFLYHKPNETRRLALTDPDPNILKSAATYLVQVARSSKGGR